MRCPICGSKMVDNKICKYCGITNEQVINASNVKAKQAIKMRNRQEVYYSTTMPNDVNKTTLFLLTLFLGFFGAGNFYVGKYVKGAYCFCASFLGLLSSLLLYLSEHLKWGLEVSFTIMMQICSSLLVLVFLFWIFDVFNILLKNYKIPVILEEKKDKVL